MPKIIMIYKNIKILLYLMFIGSSILSSKNIIRHYQYDPPNRESLDVEIFDENMIVTANRGGFVIYDISDPELPIELSNLDMPDCPHPYFTEVYENYAYFSCHEYGLALVDISDLSAPELITIFDLESVFVEDIVIKNDILTISAHNDGILFYDISDPTDPQLISQMITENSWSVLYNGDILYIVNGEGGIKVADISDINNPGHLMDLPTDSPTKDIDMADNLLYVAIGSGGVNVYDISNPAEPVFLDNFNTSGLGNRISCFNNKVAVSDWEDIKILEFDGETLNIKGFKNTGKRTMAIDTVENYIYSGEWRYLQVMEYGYIPEADIDINIHKINFPVVNPGESDTMYLSVANNGHETLIFGDYSFDWSEFETSTHLDFIEPDVTVSVEIIYNASELNASGRFYLITNDPDEPEIYCEINGNYSGVTVGQEAPDFDLPIIANGTGNFQLTNHIGQIIVIAFFHPM